MSRSNPQAKNPATRFFQWSGGAEVFKEDDGKTNYEGGKVSYYDKETEENIEVALPFTFLVLDELNTVSGFKKSEKSSFWSNEVRNITKDQLTVKSKSGVNGRGTWAELKGEIVGAKYAKSVYIAFRDETGEFAIGNIKIMGGALSAWIEFQKKYDVQQCAVMIDVNPEVKKNGTTYYFEPIFDAREVSAETDEEAKKLDVELQSYLRAYFNRAPEEDSPKTYATTAAELDDKAEEPEIEDVEVKDGKTVPAAPAKAEEPAKPKAAPAEADESIPIKDVPF